MLDRVGEVNIAPPDAGLFERLVEHRTGWADEGGTLAIFLVARLLSDEDDARLARAAAKHDLSGRLVEVTPATFLRRPAEHAEARRLRHEGSRRPFPARIRISRAAFLAVFSLGHCEPGVYSVLPPSPRLRRDSP